MALGVTGVGVPSAFTILAPETATWPTRVRVGVLLTWLVFVAVAVWFARLREERGDEIAEQLWDVASDDSDEPWSHHWKEAEVLVGGALVEYLLAKHWPGIPRHYRLSVYIYDDTRDILSPVYPKTVHASSLNEFAPGKGATGISWVEHDLIVVHGLAVSDGTYDLRDEQQRHYRKDQVVAAVPVTFDGAPVGVLTAISRKDDGFFVSPAGQQKFRQLSYAVGIVLEGSTPSADDGASDQQEPGSEVMV